MPRGIIRSAAWFFLLTLNSLVVDDCIASDKGAQDSGASAQCSGSGQLCGVSDGCVDDERCAAWLSTGDLSNCTSFPSLLQLHCPVSCGTCSLHASLKAACKEQESPPLQVSAAVAENIGDLENMCLKIEARARQLYRRVELLSSEPWLLQIDDFLDAEEARGLVALAEAHPFLDGALYTETPHGGQRASATSFCRGQCEWDVHAAKFASRTEALLNVSALNFEPVQFVRYESGQYYKQHSDFVHEDVEKPPGPRLFTLFTYLSPPVRGGETRFPHAGKSVAPQQGRALVWVNAGGYQGRKRFRWLPAAHSEHEAMEVLEGTKYSANLWVHNHDFKTNQKYECKTQV